LPMTTTSLPAWWAAMAARSPAAPVPITRTLATLLRGWELGMRLGRGLKGRADTSSMHPPVAVSEGSAEVDRSGAAQRADGEVPQAGHHVGSFPSLPIRRTGRQRLVGSDTPQGRLPVPYRVPTAPAAWHHCVPLEPGMSASIQPEHVVA
jgi:hypothetical protein